MDMLFNIPEAWENYTFSEIYTIADYEMVGCKNYILCNVSQMDPVTLRWDVV